MNVRKFLRCSEQINIADHASSLIGPAVLFLRSEK